MSISRRHFLKSCSTVAVGFMGLHRFVYACSPADVANASTPGYGPLLSDPKGILDLPRGFSYKIISTAGEMMDDGFFLPGAPDGMATFEGPGGTTILIRNHELTPNKKWPFGKDKELLSKVPADLIYDAGFGKNPSCGGTTTLVYDTKTQTVERQFLSLIGTIRNCAGGATPWNSWISCEEAVDKAEPGKLENDHGYNFEVPATAHPAIANPLPLRDMGRFNHEAVAVDEPSGIVYQTEDRGDGLIYRFIPHTKGELAKGGKLQALVVIDKPQLDTRNWDRDLVPVGEKLATKWIDMENVESPDDDLRKQGYAAGAARFARGEGMWTGEDGIYFACTNGGRKEYGQIWRYVPGENEGTSAEKPGTVELFVEPNDKEICKNADNLTVAKWGDIIVCEDRGGDTVRLIGITPQGQHYTFGHNHMECEFAGATFSPDYSTMFVNIQAEGLTLAITGPWQG